MSKTCFSLNLLCSYSDHSGCSQVCLIVSLGALEEDLVTALGVDLEAALEVDLEEDSVAVVWVVEWVVAWEECLEVLVGVAAMAVAEQTTWTVSSCHEQGILSTCEVFHSLSQKMTLSR